MKLEIRVIDDMREICGIRWEMGNPEATEVVTKLMKLVNEDEEVKELVSKMKLIK